MSLFATIQQSSNALQVNQLGLHVVGNNIANSNTPGYIRQELVQSPAVGGRMGDVILGLGVRAVGVVQKLDEFTVERLRQTESSLASSEAQATIYRQLESIFGELTSSDLSTQLGEFSNAIQDVLNQPGNDSLRRLVIERAQTMVSNIHSVGRQMDDITRNLNQEVHGAARDINRLTEQLAKLNRRIVEMEGGRSSGSDAVGLRDERLKVLQDLAKIVDIRAVEQQSGAVTVFVGGEYLVADGIQRPVTTALAVDGELSQLEVRLVDTNSPLQITSGRLHGIYSSRESGIGQVKRDLDEFARDLISQFNRIHTQGQGAEGYTEATGTNPSDDPTAALDLAGFSSNISNGDFKIQVLDLETGATRTSIIRIKLNGSSDDTSLEDVAAQIDAASGLSAEITAEGKLRIGTDSHSLRFSFAEDNSNFLAAAGINTFFVGDNANNIGINSVISNNPRLLAASLTGVGSGTENALLLAQAFDEPLSNLGGQSIKESFESMVVRMTQDINVQNGITDGLKNFYSTLESQHLATSGVNLDEEAVKMLFYQRAFQASSRLIQASSELLDVLVQL